MSGQALHDWEVTTVASSFAKAAKGYDSAARLQRMVGQMLYDKLEHDFSVDQFALDIGAGTGFCTELLSRLSNNVIALDIAPAMLVQARHRLAAKASYVTADTTSIALQTNAVDIVFANLVLQWCVDFTAALHEIKRVVKVGGQVVFSILGPQTLCELRAAWQLVDDYRHINDFIDCHYLEHKLQQAGLTGSIETQVIQLEYNSPMHLMREIKTLGAVNMSNNRLRGLTGKQRLLQVCEAYNRLMTESSTHATWEVILCHLKVSDQG